MDIHTNSVYNGQVLVRKQIVVSSAIDKRIRRLARAKGVSQSAIVTEAVAALADPTDQLSGILSFAGIIEDAPPMLSKEVDETLYG